MTALILGIALLELIAYFMLLGRLANVTKARRPQLFGAVGAPGPWDYLVLGFGPGDTFISKLETRRAEVAGEPQILKLMRAVRGVHVALLVTAGAWLIAIIAHAN